MSMVFLQLRGEGFSLPSPLSLWRDGVMVTWLLRLQSLLVRVRLLHPLKEAVMNESKAFFFLAGLLVGLATFDFVMLFYYILV